MILKNEKGIYQRNEGRWEARFKIGTDDRGRAKYRSIYAQTRDEVIQRRKEILETMGSSENRERRFCQLNLLILGAGTHGRDIYDIAQSMRVFQKIRFLDDVLEGDKIIGKCMDAATFQDEYPCAFIAIGNNAVRKEYAELLRKYHFLIPSIVSPAAHISSKATIGEGVAILPQATVGEAQIGNFCILASNCLVNSECRVEDFAHIDCGGIVKKGSTVPDGTLVEIGSIF